MILSNIICIKRILYINENLSNFIKINVNYFFKEKNEMKEYNNIRKRKDNGIEKKK